MPGKVNTGPVACTVLPWYNRPAANGSVEAVLVGHQVIRLGDLVSRHYISWPYLLALVVLAGINAVVFPLYTGYQGGEAPLASTRLALPHLGLAVLNGIALLLVYRALWPDRSLRLGHLVLLAVFARLAYLVMRATQGASFVDPDVALYFRYAKEFAGGHYPAMEYPQAALLLFTGAFMLAGGNATVFSVVFPAITLFFDLMTLATLVWLGEHYRTRTVAALAGLCFAISPFTLVLWFGKYDGVPASLLALGVYFFVVRRHYLSALFLAVGFLAKWFPGLALAVIFFHLLRAGQYQRAFAFLTVSGALILLPLLLFALGDPERVVQTYTFHFGRPLMGESVLYLPVYLFEPAARHAPGTSPWTDVSSHLMSNQLATAIQAAGVGLAIIGAVIRRRRASALVFAALAIALFIVLNRVYSPQYLLVLLVAYTLALLASRPDHRLAAGIVLVFLALTFLNYLVWPLWVPAWELASTLFFALNIVLIVLFAALAILRTPVESGRRAESEPLQSFPS